MDILREIAGLVRFIMAFFSFSRLIIFPERTKNFHTQKNSILIEVKKQNKQKIAIILYF